MTDHNYWGPLGLAGADSPYFMSSFPADMRADVSPSSELQPIRSSNKAQTEFKPYTVIILIGRLSIWGQSSERNLSIFICARQTLAISSPGDTIASYGVVSGATTCIQDSGSLTLTIGGKLEFL